MVAAFADPASIGGDVPAPGVVPQPPRRGRVSPWPEGEQTGIVDLDTARVNRQQGVTVVAAKSGQRVAGAVDLREDNGQR
jgi:hypothetical protein